MMRELTAALLRAGLRHGTAAATARVAAATAPLTALAAALTTEIDAGRELAALRAEHQQTARAIDRAAGRGWRARTIAAGTDPGEWIDDAVSELVRRRDEVQRLACALSTCRTALRAAAKHLPDDDGQLTATYQAGLAAADAYNTRWRPFPGDAEAAADTEDAHETAAHLTGLTRDIAAWARHRAATGEPITAGELLRRLPPEPPED